MENKIYFETPPNRIIVEEVADKDNNVIEVNIKHGLRWQQLFKKKINRTQTQYK